uniref:B box-type domain-containing protein n=1 Tax=viral metagenome TaxID=1070528 RepID=A0A6M3KQB8_9ZZZZ
MDDTCEICGMESPDLILCSVCDEYVCSDCMEYKNEINICKKCCDEWRKGYA